MLKERSALLRLCASGLEQKGLASDARYKDRLRKEIREIDAQGEHEYLLSLYIKFNKEGLMFPDNEHNNLVDFLLGLAPVFDIERESAYVQGESPDIDIDYIKPVRDYLKRDWAAATFGQDQICEIGTYGTAGIKSAILDMASVHGVSKSDIQSITVRMEDKDDEGKTLEWDKIFELAERERTKKEEDKKAGKQGNEESNYLKFAEWCEEHPEVAEAARLMQGRNKNAGVHAGGLIIADRPIHDFVPMEVRSVKKETPQGVICSAWTEGLAHQDLQPVGLIKFDLLVINNLMQIAQACELVKQRHGLKRICGTEDGWDFSDISYLNDPKALEMANRADLRCIFQFDSDGIRKLVKRGGVTRFDDLAAYSAIYRPGPLGMGMDARYCKRKKFTLDPNDEDAEPYSIHPLMEPILGKTYGVMAYQEQVMDILRVVGNVPDMHTEKVRKAISKKKVKLFIKYKEMFVENGMENLGVNADFCLNLWDQIESFAEYGFNKSVDTCTLVAYPGGVKEIASFEPGETVFCVNEDGETVETEVVEVHDHGNLCAFEATFDDGSMVICSADHKFLTEKGQIPLREICRTRSPIYVDKQHTGDSHGECKENRLENQMWQSGENQEADDQASQRMSRMSKDRMGQCSSQISLWERVSDLSRTGEALERMPRLRGDQEGECTPQDGEVEQGQRTSRSQKDNVRDSQEDFCQTGDSSSTCCSVEEMARRESREICEMHRSGLEESKAISDGSMASQRVGLENETNSLWRREKASRFCEGQNLDRSRWFLSFLRTSLQRETGKIASCSTTRQYVEERSDTSQGRDVGSCRHDMFQEQFGSDAGGVVRIVAGHAPITNTGRLASRRIVGIRYVGERRMCDLEVANPTHNFLLSNGVVTSNSHAYAYSYISARLLWLKAHYPLEFYTATLMCENDDDKFREYKLDAKKHGIEVRPVDINKSRANFNIFDDKIYFGFRNIKGVGEAVADRIVECQPYKSFADFLGRFGTDGGPIKALIAIGVCNGLEPDYDREHLRKFHEFYKDMTKKRKDRQKRFELAMEKKDTELYEMIGGQAAGHAQFEQMCEFTEDAERLWDSHLSGIKMTVDYKSKGEIKQKEVNFVDLLKSLAKKRNSSFTNFESKEKEDNENPVTMDQFNAGAIKLEEGELAVLRNEMTVDGVTTYPEAESLYYGFQWVHVLETSPDFDPKHTIDHVLEECETTRTNLGTIQIIIKSVRKRTSRNGNEFYSVDVEDANARQMKMNVWMNDFTRWREELRAGKMLYMRIRPPSGGYNTLTLESMSKQKRKKDYIPEDDIRIVPMDEPEPVEVEKPVDLDGLQFDEVLWK